MRTFLTIAVLLVVSSAGFGQASQAEIEFMHRSADGPTYYARIPLNESAAKRFRAANRNADPYFDIGVTIDGKTYEMSFAEFKRRIAGEQAHVSLVRESVVSSDKCLETIPSVYHSRPVWLTWRVSECDHRIANPRPGNRRRVTIEDVVAKNILVTDDMVVIHPRKDDAYLVGTWSDAQYYGPIVYPPLKRKQHARGSVRPRATHTWADYIEKHAHAQQQPKAIIPPADTIKMPEKENSMLRDLQTQMDKLRESYKLAEYEKEAKALFDIYQNGVKTLEAKYKLAEFKKEASPVGQQMSTVAQFAVIDAKLTDEQQSTLELFKDEKSGDWGWRPKPVEPARKVN